MPVVMNSTHSAPAGADSPRLSALDQSSVDRFCYQYLQLEARLDYPEGRLLKRPDVQDEIFQRICRDHDQGDAGSSPRNARFELRTLKELASRVQTSISDEEADEYVRVLPYSWLNLNLIARLNHLNQHDSRKSRTIL